MQVIKKIIVVVALLAVMALGPAATAVAQSDVVIDELIVRVWPEFDNEAALVFLIGSVEAGTERPVSIQVTLPDGIEPFAVAYEDGDNLLTTESTQIGNTVTMTSPNGTFYIEFYDPSFRFDGNTRSYTLDYVTNYDINRFIWGIQLPPGTNEESLTAFEDGSFTMDQYGLTVYEGVIENVAAGSTVPVSYNYERVMTQFTAEMLAEANTAAAPETTASPAPASPGGLPQWAIIVIILLTLVLIGLGMLYYLNNRPQPASTPRAASAASKKKKNSQPTGAGKRFCTHCGQPVDGGDTFCRHCGHQLG